MRAYSGTNNNDSSSFIENFIVQYSDNTREFQNHQAVIKIVAIAFMTIYKSLKLNIKTCSLCWKDDPEVFAKFEYNRTIYSRDRDHRSGMVSLVDAYYYLCLIIFESKS